MSSYLMEYLPIVVFLAIAIGLSAAFVIGSVIVGAQRPDPEKLSAYECGFEAFDDSRSRFDIRFYLVAILLLFLTLKSPFYSLGLYHWVKSGCLVSGQCLCFWSY